MRDISYECVNVSVEKYILISGFLAFLILENVLCHYIIFSRHFNFEFLKKIESQRERERERERGRERERKDSNERGQKTDHKSQNNLRLFVF